MDSVIHAPGEGGLFNANALCGVSRDDAPLTMHVWDYTCPDCARLMGERS